MHGHEANKVLVSIVTVKDITAFGKLDAPRGRHEEEERAFKQVVVSIEKTTICPIVRSRKMFAQLADQISEPNTAQDIENGLVADRMYSSWSL